MSFVSLQSDASSTIVIEMQYVKSWQIAPIYNATRLYLYLVVCSWSFAWKWNIKLRSHMRGAVAERWQADFDIPALLPRVCSHTRGADTGGSAISWGQRWFGARRSEADMENWVSDPFVAERILLPLRLSSATAYVWTHVMICVEANFPPASAHVHSPHVWTYLKPFSSDHIVTDIH